VFVLASPQAVELAASSSVSTAAVGESVVLHAKRSTKGTWKRISSRDLKADQCWMAVVPPEQEEEVADNLHWRVEPTDAARFNTDFRPDHTRIVVPLQSGEIRLTPSTSVWCEPGRSVAAAPLTIKVSPK
jgi:hypothetical protein